MMSFNMSVIFCNFNGLSSIGAEPIGISIEPNDKSSAWTKFLPVTHEWYYSKKALPCF